MIDAISGWVRDLAVMALTLAFAEMLLPRNDLRKFARVVIGLVLVAVILGSLVDLSSIKDVLATTSALAFPETANVGARDYAAEGNRVAQAGLEVASRGAKARLERQVESLARLASGGTADARVELGPSGEILKVSVAVRLSPTSTEAREPEDGGTSRGTASVVAARVEEALRDFYGLSADVPVVVDVRG